MQIWLRIPKNMLTKGGRHCYGEPISYDELSWSMNRMGIECVLEYPEGDANDAIQKIPPNPGEYMTMWYGDPAGWIFDDYPNRGVIGFTRCGETVLPREMVENLNKCDLVFVGSTEAKKCFEQVWDVPVEILLGGIIPDQFPYLERDYENRTFTFLHVGSTQWRKGSDIACKAFANTFSPDEDVRLLIISPGKTPMFEELEKQYGYDNRLEFVSKIIFDRWQMAEEYYKDGHILVYPSIMEGWGRCLTEALYTGMPALCFRASGMLDQFNDGCGWWIEPDIEKFDGYAMPSVSNLAEKMSYAFEHKHLCKVKGQFAHEWARDNLTWEIGINKALPMLKSVYESKSL